MFEDDFEAELEPISPQYKMILTYDIHPYQQENHYQFVMDEFLPALQEMGLYIAEAWHTAYGEYPMRMATFLAEDISTVDDALASERWHSLEDRLLRHVRNYSMKVVSYRPGFQFIRSS